jgi:DNA-binding CsgD family transcriptional regulator/tetratricopeptide (TPR) repeat protein
VLDTPAVRTPTNASLGLLEREPFMTSLARRLADAAGGDGSLVLVMGEAGVGKSALVRGFCTGPGLDARVFRGACEPLRTPRPLGPLLDIARAAGGEVARAVAAERPRHTIFAALLDLLASARPSIVVMEDVHWADEATCDLLLYLGRRVTELPVLVLVTYRDEEVAAEHPLRVVVGTLATAPGVERLRVPPLSPAGVAELAAPFGADADRLFEATGGNPFYVTEVLAASGQALPPTVCDAVLARAARLSPAARRTLDAVAVLPDRAELDVLRAIGAADPGPLDECAEAGMLLVDARTAAFRHELARMAVEQMIPAARRSALHADVLATLRTDPLNDPARLAYHADEAGDDAAVLAYSQAAAERAAALGAHREAAQHYMRALRVAAGAPQREQAELWQRLSWQLWGIGQTVGAIDAAQRAVALWRAIGDPDREAAQLANLAGYLMQSGRRSESDDTIRTAVGLLNGRLLSAGRAAAHAWQAMLHMLHRDIDRAIAAGRIAISDASALGDIEMLARALNAVGSAQWFIDPDEANRTMTRCLAVARESGDDVAVAVAIHNFGSGAGEVRRYGIAERWLREAVDFAETRDLDPYRMYSLAWLGRIEFEQGRWAAATNLTMAALGWPSESLLAPGADFATDLVAFTTLGRLRVRRGDPDPTGPLDRAWEMAVETGDLQRLWPVAAGRAEAAWLAGRPEQIEELVTDTYRLAVRLRHPWAVGELGYWMWRAGAIGAAPDGAAVPYALEMTADPHVAANAWRQLGCPYEAAIALAGSDAPGDVRAAHEELAGFRALPAADLVARRLRELGMPNPPRRPRRRTRDNPGQLTDRQMDILALLPGGLRNAEIAARLHISPKTVDHHVSAILTKLGVESRHDAARWAEAHAVRESVDGPDR